MTKWEDKIKVDVSECEDLNAFIWFRIGSFGGT
jgi:hypothetical protein